LIKLKPLHNFRFAYGNEFSFVCLCVLKVFISLVYLRLSLWPKSDMDLAWHLALHLLRERVDSLGLCLIPCLVPFVELLATQFDGRHARLEFDLDSQRSCVPFLRNLHAFDTAHLSPSACLLLIVF
jgi:hypothetical protein